MKFYVYFWVLHVSQEYSPFPLYIHPSRYPHPISPIPIPSASGAWHCRALTFSAALLLLLWSPRTGPLTAEGERLSVPCHRGKSRPTPLPLTFADTFWDLCTKGQIPAEQTLRKCRKWWGGCSLRSTPVEEGREARVGRGRSQTGM